MKSVIKKEIRPHSFAAWMAFMRPKTFWIAAAPVCVGTAFAGALAGTWNLWIFLFTLLGAVSIQAMSNMVNDYAYNLKKAENGTRVGLPRATTEGWISMSAAKKMVGFSIVVCSLFGILLIVIGGLPIACIAVLSLICGFCYMGGPKPIAYTPFGEFLVLVFYGLFAVSGTYWLQTHSFNWLTLVPGLSLGLIGAAVLFVNNYRDLDHDRSVGRYTLVAACGRKLANTLYMLMIFLPFVFIGWMIPVNQHYWPFLFVLMALPRASFLPHLLKTSPQEKITTVMFKTIQLELFFGFLLTLSGIAVAFLSWPSTQLASNLFVSPF